MTGRVMVTGADGYLGRRTAARFLADTDSRLVLTVRASDREELADKRAGLLAALGDAADGRTEVVPADLTRDAPLAEVATTLTGIVHSAARTAFDVSRTEALRVNVDGTLRVARFAAGCDGLESFVLLSTLVSAGCRTGEITETLLDDGVECANHYEWSKGEAERRLSHEFPGLPVTIARLATIVADDESGRVTQYNAFHNTLKLFFYGLLTLMPGRPDTRLYLATADFTSRGIVHLARSGTAAGVYHLAPDGSEAVRLGEALDTVFTVFESDPSFRRRRLLRPEFCDRDSFGHLVSAARSLGASPAAGALRSVAPFAEQMFHPKLFDHTRLLAHWHDAPGSSGMRLVTATCESLVRTRWGRHAPSPTPTGPEA
ncbi:SDR family oxidoreductase [Streptomyces sp. enrichment culture]|uniref:SDR family oxidoreductase n=1 Tax=Streptomyces sp. enrichment culture TaxID=1795815 RepID=UPI003F564450